jgi:hypothetical protein
VVPALGQNPNAHTAASLVEFLAVKWVKTIPHLPYSLDLA